MAQFVLESGAGESELYKKSYNGFGIKASSPWVGEKVLHESREADGKLHSSYFRKYPSLGASIADHTSFFTSTAYRQNTAYKASIQADNYREEAEGLTGIYAGDKEYGKKLIKIIEKYNLTQYDVKVTDDDVIADWKPQIIDRRDVAIGVNEETVSWMRLLSSFGITRQCLGVTAALSLIMRVTGVTLMAGRGAGTITILMRMAFFSKIISWRWWRGEWLIKTIIPFIFQ